MMINGDVPEGSVWSNDGMLFVYAFVQSVTDAGMVTYSLLDTTLNQWDRFNRCSADEFQSRYTLMPRIGFIAHKD